MINIDVILMGFASLIFLFINPLFAVGMLFMTFVVYADNKESERDANEWTRECKLLDRMDNGELTLSQFLKIKNSNKSENEE